MIPSSLAGLPEHLPRPPPRASTPHRNRSPPPIPHDQLEAPPDDSAYIPQHSPPPTPIETRSNRFRIFRRYAVAPQHDPEEGMPLDTFADAPSHARPTEDPDESNPLRPFGTDATVKSAQSSAFAPFLNASVFRLMKWFYSGSVVKSASELDKLVNNVLLADDFDRDDLRGFSAAREFNRVDEYSTLR